MNRAFRLRPLFLVWMLLSLLASDPLRATEDHWETVGPTGADVTALAVAPSASRILYAGTSIGEVYRSADAGVTWQDVSGDFPAYRPVDDLEIDPRNPARAWAVVCDPEYYDKPAVGGLFRTVDAGRTWTLVDSLDECQVLDLAIDPRNPGRMLAATVHGLYQSTDGGTTWRAQTGRFRPGHVMVLEFDPGTPGVVYGIDYYEGFLRSTNAGATWTVRNAGLPDPRPPFNGLAISTGGPKTLLLHGYNNHSHMFRSLDGGLTWSLATHGLEGRPVTDVAAGASPPRFYAATDDGVWVSANRGTSWQAPAGGSAFRLVRVLAVPPSPAPAASGVIHAGTAEGIRKSGNRGATWEDTNRGLPPVEINSLELTPADDKVLYVNNRYGTPLRTLDGGATWTRGSTQAALLEAHPEQPRTALGFAGRSVWKTLDAGTTWRRLGLVEKCVEVNGLVFDPQTPDNVYATGTPSPSCFPAPCTNLKSTDGGATWSCMGSLPNPVKALLIAPSQPSTLYAHVNPYPAPQRFFKTVDAGVSWQPVGADLGGVFIALPSVSPEDPDTLYAKFSPGAVRSTDGAATWDPVAGLPAGLDFALAVAPSDASVLYAYTASNEGPVVYHSADAGASWAPLSTDGLPRLFTLQVSPTDPRTVYAVAHTGLHRLRH